MKEEEKKYWALAKNAEESRILHCTNEEMHERHMFVWSSLSCRYETKEELIAGQGIPEKPCVECGQVFGTHYYEPVKQRLLENNICHTCDFWRSKLEIRNNPSSVRIKGTHYIIAPDNPNRNAFRGFGGAEFNIRFNDGRLVTTHNLWCQGDIPKRFRERLPDNATFVEVRHTERDKILEKLIPNAKSDDTAE